MSDEDWWSRWSSRKQRWPFFRGWFSEDINEFFKEMEELMEREFKELSKQAPSGLVRERTMPDGRKVKQWGPFVYGYSVTIGPDGKPEIKEFGNVKPETRRGRPRIRIAEEREPLVDILVIAAHPDDEVLGVGGTIVKYVHMGAGVYIYILSEGATSRYEDKMVAQLKESTLKASRILGVKDVYCEELPDEHLDQIPFIDLIKPIERLTVKIKPDIVFTHHRGDANTRSPYTTARFFP